MKELFYLCIMCSFFISNKTVAQNQNFNTITFTQGDSVYKINKRTDSILLKRNPFAIKYFGLNYNEKKFYAAQIAVLNDPKDTLILKIGQRTKNIPYFEAGTGMAPGENNRYDTIVVSNVGHHYLYYESEKEKRVTLISKQKGFLELEWKISAASFEEKDFQFSELPLQRLFFVVFIDRNLNEIIDKNELKIIQVKFK
jgi:hypothetical protein